MIEQYTTRADFANSMIDKYFINLPNNIVSDIGAGYGHMKNKIEESGFKWQPFDYYKKMDYSIIWDLNNEYPKETTKAGGVIFLEVLEHLANPLLGLKNIANHMEKGAILVLTTPNPQSSKNTLNLFLKGTLYVFQPKHLKEYHVFTPWEHIVQNFLKTAGFEIKEYAIVDTSYKSIKPKGLKGKIKRVIENYIEKRNPKALGMSYGIVAIKK